MVATIEKWRGAFAVVAASFFITLRTMDYYSSTCPRGDTTALAKPFPKWGSLSYFAAAPSLIDISDSSTAPSRSNAMVCEDNRVLGPAHSMHADIAAKGGGRFSRWMTGFVFSASDNSDPNSNGRSYSAVLPR